MSNAAKATIALVLGIVVLIGAVSLIKRSSRNAEVEKYNELVEKAAADGITELPVNNEQLEILLRAASDIGANQQRQTIYKALFIAKAQDGSDIDTVMAKFATEEEMQPDVRAVIIRDVLRKRGNPAIVPILLKFTQTTTDTNAAIAALEACKTLATDAHFNDFLDVIKFTSEDSVRQAAVETVSEIVRRSENREAHATALVSAYEGAINDDIRHSMLRLLARAGGDRAEEIVRTTLESDETKDQLAAIYAMSVWADESMFETLMEYLEGLDDEQIRPRAFDAGFRYLTDPDRTLDADMSEDFWKMLARNAKIRSEQMKIIGGLAAKETDDWAISVIEYFVDEADDDEVIDRAEQALTRIQTRTKLKSGSSDTDEEEEDEDKDEDEDEAEEEE